MSISQVGTQAGGATVDASTTASRAYPSNVTAGNLVYIACSTYNGNAATTFTAGSCTKSAGTATLGTITLDKQVSGSNITAAIWSAIVTGSGSLTLTLTSTDAGNNNYWAIGSDELSATNGWDSGHVETTNSGTGNATTQTTGNMTSAGGAAFVGVTSLDTAINETTYTKAAAYTQIYKETDGTAHEPGIIEIHIVSSGTTEAATTTLTAAKAYAAAGVVYKEAVATATSIQGRDLTNLGPGISPNKRAQFRARQLSISNDKSVALTGSSLTLTQGTLSPAIDTALTGSTLTITQGTLVPSGGDSSKGKNLSFVGPGITPDYLQLFRSRPLGFTQTSPDVTVALTGTALTILQGILTPAIDTALSGSSLTITEGTIVPAISVALSGSSLTISQGSVSPATSVALTGTAETISQGALSPEIDIALGGQQIVISQGNLQAPGDVTVALTGTALTLAQGALSPSGGDVTTLGSNAGQPAGGKSDGWSGKFEFSKRKIKEKDDEETTEEAEVAPIIEKNEPISNPVLAKQLAVDLLSKLDDDDEAIAAVIEYERQMIASFLSRLQ